MAASVKIVIWRSTSETEQESLSACQRYALCGRTVIEKHEIAHDGVKLDSLLSDLTKRGVLTALERKEATAAAARLRTSATHARWDEFNLNQVETVVRLIALALRCWLLLDGDGDAGGKMVDAHRRIGLVDGLAAGARGATAIDAQFLVDKLDPDLVVDFSSTDRRRCEA